MFKWGGFHWDFLVAFKLWVPAFGEIRFKQWCGDGTTTLKQSRLPRWVIWRHCRHAALPPKADIT